MAGISKKAYGIGSPLIGIFPSPIVATIAPTANNRGEIGISWVDESTNTVYVLTSIVANASVWTVTSTGGAGVFTTLNVTGNATIGGTLGVTGRITATVGLTATAGGITITAGGLTVTAGGAAITGNSTVTGTLTSTNSLTVNTGGATITAGGLTVTAGGATVTAGGLTVTAGGAAITGTTTITAGNAAVTISTIQNAANAILLNANGGVGETIGIRSQQGTGANSINLVSSAGGITLNGLLGTSVTTQVVSPASASPDATFTSTNGQARFTGFTTAMGSPLVLTITNASLTISSVIIVSVTSNSDPASNALMTLVGTRSIAGSFVVNLLNNGAGALLTGEFVYVNFWILAY